MTNQSFFLFIGLAVLGMAGILLAPAAFLADVLTGRVLALHLLMELVAVWVATLVVVVSYCSFGKDERRGAQVLIAGFVMVAVSDLMHAFTFAGMQPLFGESSVQRTIYFWLAGRAVEVVTLGMLAVGIAPRLSHGGALLIGVVGSAGILWLGGPAFGWVPTTYVPGVGLTPFKVGFEIVLALANFAIAAILWRTAPPGGQQSSRLLALSCVFMGLAGFAFANYKAPSDFQNIAGHIYKVVAYVLLYQAIFIRSLRAPYEALAQSEAELRSSRARLAAMDINLPGTALFQMVRRKDGTRHFTDVSPGLSQVLQIEARRFLQDPTLPDRMLHPDDVSLVRAAEKRSEESLQPLEVEPRCVLPDGQIRVIRLAAAPRRADNGDLLWDGIVTDITERREAELKRRHMEQQLLQAQKMESIGTLASGIAHDFNNVLVAIMGNARLALEDVRRGAGADVVTGLEQIQKAGANAQILVRQIMGFSRKGEPEKVVQPLAPVITESLSFLRATLPGHIALTTDLQDPDARAEFDAVQLQQVLLNLCTNAWHAIGAQAGRIRVTLALQQLTTDDALSRGLLPGRYVQLSVEDDGCGMDDETQRRVFEPFFTTKPAGQGTGLGLSMVHGIVQAHGGAVKATSRLGQGTRFDIYLPADAPPGPTVAPVDGVSGRASANGEAARVLYIDDDAVIAATVDRLLTANGLEVVVATDPTVALEVLRRDAPGFALVITDYNMPRHSGLDVIAEIARIDPQLPCVLVSGFVTPQLRARALALQVAEVIAKDEALDVIAPIARRAARRRASTVDDRRSTEPLSG